MSDSVLSNLSVHLHSWTRSAVIALLAIAGLGAPAAMAQHEEAQYPPAGEPADLLSHQCATGDWFGVRSAMAKHGIFINLELFADYSYNFSGGLETGDAFRHLLNSSFALETKPLIGWEGGRFFLGVQVHGGDNGTEDLIGDFQGFDNIDADDFTQVSELWYEQTFWDQKARIKVGKVDANSEFAHVEYGGEFLNSSAGVSPTILGMPTYPDPATSINLLVHPAEWFYAGFGLYDGASQDGSFGRTGNRGPSTAWGAPSDLFLIAEAGLEWKLRQGRLPGRLGVGAWRHTGSFERFDGGSESGASGGYGVLDQLIWRENPAQEGDEQGIGLFAQFGWADPRISEVQQHIGLGFAWSGAIPGRDDDVWGLMASTVRFSDEDAAGFAEDREAALELFYRFQFTPWFALKADLQYIANPGGAEGQDAVVGTLRAEIAF